MKRLKISDIFNFDTYSGVDWLFNVFNSSSGTPPTRDYPLLEDIVTDNNESILNEDYFFIHSADKYLSPFAQRLWEQVNEDDATFFNAIAPVLYNRFGVKWKKIYDALMTNYKPLENYNMLQEETPDITKTRKTNTATDITTSTSSDSENGVVGFNSTLSNKATTSKQTGQVNVTGDSLNNQEDVEETETGKRTL